jgi:hypothetical protein
MARIYEEDGLMVTVYVSAVTAFGGADRPRARLSVPKHDAEGCDAIGRTG